LPFGPEKSIKLSYAASFGVMDYPDNLLEEIKPLLKKFKAISVREKSGLEILKKAGIKNSVLSPDPTLLLNEIDYSKIIQGNKTTGKCDFFFYVLQKHQNIIDKIYKDLKKDKSNKIVHSTKINYSVIGIESWLNYIKNSRFVITNSFHGVVFSIIFNTPFIVIPIEGRLEGMNDRIVTLLENYDLEDRIIWQYDEIKTSELFKKPINWEKTKAVQINLKLESQKFCIQNIYY
jgi:polysaccharide pyruvyl transferase WcaK-like protein